MIFTGKIFSIYYLGRSSSMIVNQRYGVFDTPPARGFRFDDVLCKEVVVMGHDNKLIMIMI